MRKVTSNRNKRVIQLAFRRLIKGDVKSSCYFKLFPNSRIEYIDHFKTMNWTYNSSVNNLDHIIPIAFFDLNKHEDFELAFSKFNISVLNHRCNKIKGSNIDTQIMTRYFDTLAAIYHDNKDQFIIAKLKSKVLYIGAKNPLNKALNYILSKTG